MAGDVAVTIMSRVDAEVVQLVYSKVQQHVHPRLRRQWKELARIDLQSAVVTKEIWQIAVELGRAVAVS